MEENQRDIELDERGNPKFARDWPDGRLPEEEFQRRLKDKKKEFKFSKTPEEFVTESKIKMIKLRKDMEVTKLPEGEGDNFIVYQEGRFTPVPYAEYLLKKFHFLYDNKDRFWWYDARFGIWKENADKFIRNFLRTKVMGTDRQKRSYIEEILCHIRDICWSEEDITKPDENIVAFQNCLYDVQKEEIIDFNHRIFITNKIPVDLDSQYTECPKIDQFFDDITKNIEGEKKKEQIKESLYELIAYCFLRKYPFQKFFIMWGRGANGKSTYVNIIAKVLGMDNISVETPQSLTNDKFSSGRLWNKLANISSDIPYRELGNVNALKMLTGEDPLNCERKHKEPFTFYNHAKNIWSANELPQVSDKTEAFYRRVYILPFLTVFKDEEMDPDILQNITDPKELSGLCWQLVNILKGLKTRKYRFTYNPSLKEQKEAYEDLSNPIERFIRTFTEASQLDHVTKWEYKEKFLTWLTENGFRVWGDREINTKMREKFSEGKTQVPKQNFNQSTQTFQPDYAWHRTWEGLKWKIIKED